MREERRWWYVPAIGHFAAFDEARDGVPRRRELIAWRRLESSAERDADEASALLQQALETLVSGQELSWTSADRRRKITVAPIRTFQRDALYCRDYRLSTTQDGAASLEEGTACRSPDAVWRRILEAGAD
jgi:surface antigen